MDKPLTPTDLTRSRMNEADDKQEYVTFKLPTELGDELDSIDGKLHFHAKLLADHFECF